MEIKLTFDRLEEGVAILLDVCGNVFRCQSLCDCSEGDILLCDVGDDGEITVKEKMTDEKIEKMEEMSKRLHSLFLRGEK